MSLPKKLQSRFLARFDEMIVEGKLLADSIRVIPPHTRGNVTVVSTTYESDPQRLARWKTNCLTLFHPFAKEGSQIREQAEQFSGTGSTKPQVRYALGILEAFRDDFDKGFLDDFLLKVEAEVASDYLGQAEDLLKEGPRGKYDHVPAAVLAGAVLEKALRTLCGQQHPPVSITKQNGETKMMNSLIDDLKKADLFNELKASQLRSWAHIRNKAAHGEFDQFTKPDVEQMLTGIQIFLADYLG